MAFEGDAITVGGLAKIELPGRTIRLCDGGIVLWGSETFEGEDAVFGTIESVELPHEGIADEAPGGKIVFLPRDVAALVALCVPENQFSRIRFWFAEIDRDTGTVVGSPELVGDMRLDTTTLRVGKSSYALDMSYVTAAERLMNVSDGNVLSPRFHKKVWPGETGLDHATGVPLTKAWGVQAPPRGAVATGSGGQFGGVLGAVQAQMRSASA